MTPTTGRPANHTAGQGVSCPPVALSTAGIRPRGSRPAATAASPSRFSHSGESRDGRPVRGAAARPLESRRNRQGSEHDPVTILLNRADDHARRVPDRPRAQQGEGDLSISERAYVASKLYSSIEIYFAHRAGIVELDLDAAYKAYLERALGAKGRREFDPATLEFVAQLRNKHTQFNDHWLNRKHGQPLGSGVLPKVFRSLSTRAGGEVVGADQF